MTDLTDEFFGVVSGNVLEAYTSPKIEPEVEYAPEIEIGTQIDEMTRRELQYTFTRLADVRMAKFKLIGNIGRVYLCKFLPLKRTDPVLPYVQNIEGFDEVFSAQMKTLVSYPLLDTEHSLKTFIRLYEKAKGLLSDLNDNEWAYYNEALQNIINDPLHYLDWYEKPQSPEFYVSLYVGVGLIVFVVLMLLFNLQYIMG